MLHCLVHSAWREKSRRAATAGADSKLPPHQLQGTCAQSVAHYRRPLAAAGGPSESDLQSRLAVSSQPKGSKRPSPSPGSWAVESWSFPADPYLNIPPFSIQLFGVEPRHFPPELKALERKRYRAAASSIDIINRSMGRRLAPLTESWPLRPRTK